MICRLARGRWPHKAEGRLGRRARGRRGRGRRGGWDLPSARVGAAEAHAKVLEIVQGHAGLAEELGLPPHPDDVAAAA